MFKKIDEDNDSLAFTFEFEGRKVAATKHDTIASALLREQISHFRSSIVSGQSRGPFCMMGACFECLVLVDGKKVQACMTPVTENCRVNRIPQWAESEGTVNESL